MTSQRRRRPVRPLTIYGFRRRRPRSRRLWLVLLALASLSVLPRLLSPIAEKFWGDSTRSAPRSHPPLAAQPPAQEPGNAFASPEPEGPPLVPVVADSSAAPEAPPHVAPAPSVARPAEVAHARPHRPAHAHGAGPGPAGSPQPSDRRLVPAQ